MLATAVQPQTLRTTGRTAQVVPRHHLHRLRRRRSHGQRFKVLPFHFDRHFSPLTTDCCAAAGGGLQQPASTWGAVGSPVPATIRARPGQVNESGVIVVQNPKQKRVVGAPPSVCPLIPARSGCGAAARHAKSESTSRPLRNANGHLLTRPGGRERPVSAQGRISRFRPIWGSQADMDGPGQADADGAIRRIGPSQAAGACTGGRGRVRAPRHVRWSDPRRVASHGGGARGSGAILRLPSP